MIKTSPSNAAGAALNSVRGVQIPHTSWLRNQNMKHKQYCNKFNKDYKKWPASKEIIFKINTMELIKQIFGPGKLVILIWDR